MTWSADLARLLVALVTIATTMPSRAFTSWIFESVFS